MNQQTKNELLSRAADELFFCATKVRFVTQKFKIRKKEIVTEYYLFENEEGEKVLVLDDFSGCTDLFDDRYRTCKDCNTIILYRKGEKRIYNSDLQAKMPFWVERFEDGKEKSNCREIEID